ncbi:MAG: cobalt-precorrin 5A hydrolase [Tissierellia bacterium]|nr:cobalt-precorrin 5A hydrolase [Tissierellia bacterium]
MISILSFTENGKALAELLCKKLPDCRKYHKSEIKEIGMGNIWDGSDEIIFISATGIAVRYISKFIRHKSIDPAVLVVDDMGRFVISLLSGHLGGANRFAEQISSHLPDSIPVITTASDSRGFESPDLYSQRHGYIIENSENLTKISADMVSGREIALFSEENIDWNYKNFFIIDEIDKLDKMGFESAIIISSRSFDIDTPYLQLVPRNLNIGIGCRRGIDTEDLLKFISEVFDEKKLLTSGIGKLASIDIKKDEKAILEAAEKLNADLIFFSAEKLKTVEHNFSGSDFVKEKVGVSSVAEASAYLMGELLSSRITKNKMTMAISKGDKCLN